MTPVRPIVQSHESRTTVKPHSLALSYLSPAGEAHTRWVACLLSLSDRVPPIVRSSRRRYTFVSVENPEMWTRRGAASGIAWVKLTGWNTRFSSGDNSRWEKQHPSTQHSVTTFGGVWPSGSSCIGGRRRADLNWSARGSRRQYHSQSNNDIVHRGTSQTVSLANRDTAVLSQRILEPLIAVWDRVAEPQTMEY